MFGEFGEGRPGPEEMGTAPEQAELSPEQRLTMDNLVAEAKAREALESQVEESGQQDLADELKADPPKTSSWRKKIMMTAGLIGALAVGGFVGREASKGSGEGEKMDGAKIAELVKAEMAKQQENFEKQKDELAKKQAELEKQIKPGKEKPIEMQVPKAEREPTAEIKLRKMMDAAKLILPAIDKMAGEDHLQWYWNNGQPKPDGKGNYIKNPAYNYETGMKVENASNKVIETALYYAYQVLNDTTADASQREQAGDLIRVLVEGGEEINGKISRGLLAAYGPKGELSDAGIYEALNQQLRDAKGKIELNPPSRSTDGDDKVRISMATSYRYLTADIKYDHYKGLANTSTTSPKAGLEHWISAKGGSN